MTAARVSPMSEDEGKRAHVFRGDLRSSRKPSVSASGTVHPETLRLLQRDIEPRQASGVIGLEKQRRVPPSPATKLREHRHRVEEAAGPFDEGKIACIPSVRVKIGFMSAMLVVGPW